MHSYKTIISYKGTNYFGWQSQPKEDKATIQETIQASLNKIAKNQTCSVVGASRTDSGVHALGQVAKITLPFEVPAEKLKRGLNSLLPNDIVIQNCKECSIEFNPINDALEKEYRYYILSGSTNSPFLSEYTLFTQIPIKLRLMQKAAKEFIGTHDFYNFARRDSRAKTTIREITECSVHQSEHQFCSSQLIYIKVRGKGFLKQMVRYMASAIIETGQEKIQIKEIKEHLQNNKKGKLTKKAVSEGLHLHHIIYA